MSLFKRKQSKEKDVAVNANSGALTGPVAGGGDHGPSAPHVQPNMSTPPSNTAPTMAGPHGPGAPALGQPRNASMYGSPSMPMGMPNGGSPMGPGAGRRMTSNPDPAMQQRPPSAPPASSFPWSTRPLRLFAPQASPPQPPISPFPRYGLSVPPFPSHSGHMLVFGGLVHETVRNDMWSMDVRDCTTMPVKTKGDAPMPRVGHASAIADRIMLVWGGDTKVKQDDSQDEALYVLDLRTQEWIKLAIANGPIGRYGHAVCMHESKFFVFGGQAEGAFMDDLWAFDVKQLTGEQQAWERIQFPSPSPPKRTGHILVPHNGKLYLFGGTDGQYHYNDTWSFDVATGAWTELSCIGYIPTPREGHAAAIVDDVVYIFGGRDVNGKDLGDLAAFKISTQRWFMFQNMGPAPTARSGHSMVAAHGRIFVLGGEANSTSANQRDDPSMVHILDTTKIKYPSDSQPPRQLKAKASEPSLGSQAASQGQNEQQIVPPQQPMPTSQSVHALQRAVSPPPTQISQANGNVGTPERPMPRSESLGAMAETARANGGPPQRPRREGDEEFRRALSPTNGGPSSPVQSGFPRVTSPPNGQSPSSPPQTLKHPFNASIVGTRSPSPRMRMADSADRPAPPSDAFYYSRSPTANGFHGRPSSLSGTADLIRELKSREAELDHGRKREAALRVVIGRAMAQGYVPSQEEETLIPERDAGESEMGQRLQDALIKLKQEKALIQNELVSQMRVVSEKAAEADRLRRGALQEAAFYRAKLATLESGSPVDLGRVEKERIADLERQLANLSTEHGNAQRELERLTDLSSTDKQLHLDAVEREAAAHRRADDAEEAHRATAEELEEVRQKISTSEAAVRDHAERLVTLTSLAQQREAERDQLQSQVDDAIAARDEHVGLLEHARTAMAGVNTRLAEAEAQNMKSTARITDLEGELADTRSELEARTREAEQAGKRLTEVENAYAQSREEADGLRTLTTGKLGEVIDSHREMRADEDRSTRGYKDQIRALEEEAKSLRKMLKEAGQRVDAAESGVSHHRTKARDFESQVQALRAEVRSHRTKLGKSQDELARFKDIQASRDAELREREQSVTEMETRLTMMRNLLADHGIAVNDSDGGEVPQARDLEMQLRERSRENDNAQREIEVLTRRCHEAEDKVESLGRLIERIKDARSPTSMSMRSPSPPGEDGRVAEVERRMAEMEATHKEKLAGLESDYQTAVRYVKGTEKMMKRLKDELSRQKTTNQSLQSEMDHLRGRASVEPGSARSNGRATPSPNETELSRRLTSLQNQHNAMQAELQASRDVQAAREREVEVMRMRVEEAEREVDVLRDDLQQAQQRINTLLEMRHEFSDDGEHAKLDDEGSEEASMAFDKFTKELKQWERSRSPGLGGESDDATSPTLPAAAALKGAPGSQSQAVNGSQHKRNSSEYSGNWAQ